MKICVDFYFLKNICKQCKQGILVDGAVLFALFLLGWYMALLL